MTLFFLFNQYERDIFMSNQHKAVPATPVEVSLAALYESGKLTTTKAVKQLAELKQADKKIKDHVINVTLDHLIKTHKDADKGFDQCVQICDALLPAFWYEGHKSESLDEAGKERVTAVRSLFLTKFKDKGNKNAWAQWTHLLNQGKKKHTGTSGSSGAQKHFDVRLPDTVLTLIASHKRAVQGSQDLTSAESKAFMTGLIELRDKHYPTDKK